MPSAALKLPQYRARFQNILDHKRQRFIVKIDSDDDWITITTKSLSNVTVSHKVRHGYVDLALWYPSKDIVGESVPPECEDVSTDKTRMFRWKVADVDWTLPPNDQLGAKQVIERAKWAFHWVRNNRVSR